MEEKYKGVVYITGAGNKEHEFMPMEKSNDFKTVSFANAVDVDESVINTYFYTGRMLLTSRMKSFLKGKKK